MKAMTTEELQALSLEQLEARRIEVEAVYDVLRRELKTIGRIRSDRELEKRAKRTVAGMSETEKAALLAELAKDSTKIALPALRVEGAVPALDG